MFRDLIHELSANYHVFAPDYPGFGNSDIPDRSHAPYTFDVLGDAIGVSIRPGFSDSRFFRRRNVPTVVYGVTPQNGNAPDEHVLIEDLEAVFKVHALTAFDYLANA